MTAMEGEKKRTNPILNRPYWVERNGRLRKILVSNLQLGDHIRLTVGDLIPADGTIMSGEGLLDQVTFSGEADLISCSAGDRVFASTLLSRGQITINIEGLGENTRLAEILRLGGTKEEEDTRVCDYVENLGNQVVAPALAISALTFIATGNLNTALAPLQLDFSQGVGVSAPIPVLSTIQHGVTRGRVLIKGGRTLEVLQNIDAIVFDKTGTLTERNSHIEDIETFSSAFDTDTLLFYAASASLYALDPFSASLIDYAHQKGINPQPTDTIESSDIGFRARIEGKDVLMGSQHFLQHRGIQIDLSYHRKNTSVIQNRSIRYITIDGELTGAVSYTNSLRPESATTISRLEDMGITCYMVTGDNSQVANAVAYQLGFKPSNTFSGLSAPEKVEVISDLRQSHHHIAFVGEGINDVPAIHAADIGISFNEATDLARESADLVLLDDNLQGIPYAISISKDAMKIVQQNIVLVTSANVAAVLGSAFFSMSPLTTVVVNNGATLIASLNGLKPLRQGKRIDPGITRTVNRDETSLLGIPWNKKSKIGLKTLLDKGLNT
jgi:heavy metal translocating P-type ATPase